MKETMGVSEGNVVSYITPPETGLEPRQLVADVGQPLERRFTFYESIEIGRHQEGATLHPGIILIQDPTVSSRHCIVTQAPDGRCFVRDVSRNGTRLEGRRLIPNLEVEIQIGQTVSVGNGQQFRLEGEPAKSDFGVGPTRASTMVTSEINDVTILVGDIRDYTGLVQTVDFTTLQQSINRVFQMLEREVYRFGGTIKEYPGDAIFAFWEKGPDANHALDACRAAVALDRMAREMAKDPTVWKVPGFPLKMDWALASGEVTINSLGGDRPTGLSMIGEPVVLAFRLEKLADDETGPILVCPETMAKASSAFEFDDLGEKEAKGFDHPYRVYSLVKERETA
jgi:class 3 adenylate cyclase